MATLTIKIEENEVPELLKEALKKLNLSYKFRKEKPYNPEFVEKILLAEKQIEEGKVTRYEPGTEVWEILHSR